MEESQATMRPYDAQAQARNFMHTYDTRKDTASELTKETAVELEQKKTTLIAVIESIGEYIKDEDGTIRSKALYYLSGVLENLPRNFLSRQQLDVICTFLIERIEDGGAVEGLQALQASSRFTKDLVTLTTRAVLERLQDLQIRPQKQRYVIIRLVHDILGNHRDVVKSMGEEFLAGVTDLFSGEKDPRNLMLVFSVVVVVATEWDLGAHVEPLFDSVFCYYPITFKPPPNDPYKITAQDLKERLRQCISASGKFAQFAFPQLLEKLDSGSPNVKRDVFDTLIACIQSYSPKTVAEYASKLWDSLKYEVFHAQEDDLSEEALKVIATIALKLTSSDLTEIHGSNSLSKLLNIITKECLDKLKEPQHKQAKSAARILAALAVASHQALDEIIKAIFPTLISLYQGAETIEARRSLLDCFLIILDAAVNLSKAQPRSKMDDIALVKFKDSLLEKFSQALMATTSEEMSFRVLALNCLAKLSNIPGVLLDDEVGLPVQYFNEIILNEDASGRPDLMNKAIDTLLELAESRYRVLLDITVPKILAELPDNGSTEVARYQRSIGILARLSTKRELSDIIIRRLFGRLDAALIHTAAPQYIQALLTAITFAIKSQQTSSPQNVQIYLQKVEALVKQAAEAAVQANAGSLTDMSVLRAIGRLLCLSIKTTDDEGKARFGNEVYTLFTGNAIVTGDSTLDTRRLQTIIISTYVLAAISEKSHSLDLSTDKQPRLEFLCATCYQIQDPAVQHAVLQHLCLLVNKFADADALDRAWSICTSTIDRTNPKETKESSIKVLMWLAKAQILRMAKTKIVLDYLFSLLDSEEWGDLIAAAFEILLGKDEVLTKENGAKLRLLSGQVVFTQLLEHISKVFPSVSAQNRSRYLVALGGVLRNVNPQLAVSHMKELNPLLLQSLNVPNPTLKAATITTLAIAINENPASIEEHLSSVIPQLISIAVDRKANDTSLRLKATRCLGLIPGKFKEFLLIPHIKIVDRGVVKVLDDPRRDVRKAAVDCRTAWLALDDPDEDD